MRSCRRIRYFWKGKVCFHGRIGEHSKACLDYKFDYISCNGLWWAGGWDVYLIKERSIYKLRHLLFFTPLNSEILTLISDCPDCHRQHELKHEPAILRKKTDDCRDSSDLIDLILFSKIAPFLYKESSELFIHYDGKSTDHV